MASMRTGMSERLLVCLVLLVVAVPAVCQTGAPPPAPPAPKTPPRPVPSPPLPPPAQPPAPAPATPQGLPGQPPPQVRDFLSNHPEAGAILSLPTLLGKPLTFLAVFLFVGLVFSRLVGRIILPRLGEAHARSDETTTRHLAIGNLIVCAVALAIAADSTALKSFETLTGTLMDLLKAVLSLVGSLVVGALWVVAAAVIAYAISPRGRDLVLSLLGWYYLRYSAKQPATGQEMDLGGGVRGRVVSVDALHTTLRAADGQQYTVPNAWVMKTHFNWGRESSTASPADAVGTSPPAPAAAPPPPAGASWG